MNLIDKVAIVTGAGRGIGKAIAISLALEGANVIVNDIDIQTAKKVAKEIKSLDQQALAIQVDVSIAWGATTLTFILYDANSLANDFARQVMPALEAP